MGLIGGVLNLAARVVGGIAEGVANGSSKAEVSDKSFKLETPNVKVEVSSKGAKVEVRGDKGGDDSDDDDDKVKAPQVTFNKDTFEAAPASSPSTSAPAPAPSSPKSEPAPVSAAIRAKLNEKSGIGSKLGSGTDGRGL